MTSSDKDYEKLLDNAFASLPEKKTSGERFEIPVADCFNQGNTTIVKNYDFICNRLRRKPQEFAKYLFKELAVPGSIDSSSRLILQSKIMPRLINEKISVYCETSVICRECKRPDTHLIAQKGVNILVCEACGARRPV